MEVKGNVEVEYRDGEVEIENVEMMEKGEVYESGSYCAMLDRTVLPHWYDRRARVRNHREHRGHQIPGYR